MVHTWAKDYEKHNGNLEPVQIFFSGSGGTGKSHLGKVTYNAISKSMLYQCKDPENPRVLLLVHTEISAVSIGETAIHFGLVIKPGTDLLGLNEKSKATLSSGLSEVKLLITDKLSVVSFNLWTDVDSRLGEIFLIIPEKSFAGLSVMKRNEAVPNDFSGEIYSLEANDKIPYYCKYPLTLTQTNQNQTNAGGLAKLVQK